MNTAPRFVTSLRVDFRSANLRFGSGVKECAFTWLQFQESPNASRWNRIQGRIIADLPNLPSLGSSYLYTM